MVASAVTAGLERERRHPAEPGVAYAHPAYAASLFEFGRPVALPASGGWLLERTIAASEKRDAMGTYPLFACSSWNALEADLRALQGSLVSAVLVTDPFGRYDRRLLDRTFDVARPFKSHFVVELNRSSIDGLSKHHRYYTRRAMRDVEVEVADRPLDHLDEWHALYRGLVERHGIAGIRAFSRASFEGQFQVPGLVVLRAVRRGTTVGMHLWYASQRGDGVAYSHLAATSDEGYELGAAYALHWTAIEHFRGSLRWLDLGAGAGTGAGTGAVTGAGPDGLTAFKAGWATDTRTAYICGRILSTRDYEALSSASAPAGSPSSSYFPAYRAGEYS